MAAMSLQVKGDNMIRLSVGAPVVTFLIVWAFFGVVALGQTDGQKEMSSRRVLGASKGKIQPGDASIATPAKRPNIILINLDDADVDLFADVILDEHLPNIGSLARNGLNFTNCHVVTPLCGPSRTCLLRGQHAHRTGIKTNVAAGPMNNGFSGAYQLYKSRGYDQEHLGVWMQRAGYRTMMIGKYLHGRMNPVGLPGWDDLHICFGGNYYATSRYSTRLPKELQRSATGPNEYRAIVEANEAVWMIESQAVRNAGLDTDAEDQPFFLYIAPLAPHKPAGKTVMLQNEYKHVGLSPDKPIRMPLTPDLNEADVSDKPSHLQIAKLPPEVVEGLHEEFRKRVVSLKSVDDMVGRILNSLKATGVADHTYIFFTSDHGYQLGHNRMIAKKVPYHRNTVIPMFVTGPGIRPATSRHLLAHIDLVPTFLEMAGGSAPVKLDGKSWLPLLKDPESIDRDDFRKSLLIQNWEEKSQIGELIPASYASLRMSTQIYTEWSNGQREFYDLKQDPYQLENAISTVSLERQLQFSRELHTLKQGDNQPLVTLAMPELISKNTLIRGFAEDDEAIASVEVSIHDPNRKVYWSGNEWTTKPTHLTATLLNENGLISDWHSRANLAAIQNEGQLTITATAVDDEGNRSEGVTQNFRVDAIAPETLLKRPEWGTSVQSPITLFGTCSDNQRMRGIELTLKNVETREFWNGSQWTTEPATFFKRVEQERWHTTFEVPSGKYESSARSLDHAGNYDESPSVSEFTVE